jgi:ATP-dependent exoDNAse (exonuclease V) alpha subunit
MAIYFLNMKTFGRSGGSSAVSAAAYRAGERMRDERTGKTFDHSSRQDVMHKEIVLPSEFADQDMHWARDRATLWNAAEGAESRKNARIAREYLVALPVELTPAQRLRLVRGFSQELTDRYGYAVDLAIHAPRDFPGSDPRNFHAHLLTTTRMVTSQGLGAKTALDRNNDNRVKLGMKSVVHELLHVRERWASVTNEALQEAHIATRVDHRSLAAQGIDREPQPPIPKAAFEMERHGYRSKVAERMREGYEVRVQARLSRAADRDIVHGQSSAAESAAKPSPAPPQSLEDIRREARESWLRLRQSKLQKQAESAPSAEVGRGRGDDFAR